LNLTDHSGAREKDGLLLADQLQGFRRLNFSSRNGAASFGHVDLRLDRLTFPTSGHDFIVLRYSRNGKTRTVCSSTVIDFTSLCRACEAAQTLDAFSKIAPGGQ